MSDVIPDNFRLPRFTFEQGVLASLLIHGVLVGGFFLSRPAVKHPVISHHTLMIQLSGVASNRQQEPVAKANPVTQAAQPPVPAKNEPTKTFAHGHSAVQPEVRTPAATPKPVATVKRAAGQPMVQTVTQAAQKRPEDKTDPNAMARYMAALQRVVQSHLIYPDTARAAGDNGSPVVRFSVDADGRIVPGSIGVYRSSGSSALDESALQALMQSHGLPHPPKAMAITIAISFAVNDDNEEW